MFGGRLGVLVELASAISARAPQRPGDYRKHEGPEAVCVWAAGHQLRLMRRGEFEPSVSRRKEYVCYTGHCRRMDEPLLMRTCGDKLGDRRFYRHMYH
jgi:hypothetical protein